MVPAKRPRLHTSEFRPRVAVHARPLAARAPVQSSKFWTFLCSQLGGHHTKASYAANLRACALPPLASAAKSANFTKFCTHFSWQNGCQFLLPATRYSAFILWFVLVLARAVSDLWLVSSVLSRAWTFFMVSYRATHSAFSCARKSCYFSNTFLAMFFSHNIAASASL